VVREMREEVGFPRHAAVAVRYTASQSWPTLSGAAQLMLGFLSAVDDEFTPELDGRELEAATWTDREHVQRLLTHHTDGRAPAQTLGTGEAQKTVQALTHLSSPLLLIHLS